MRFVTSSQLYFVSSTRNWTIDRSRATQSRSPEAFPRADSRSYTRATSPLTRAKPNSQFSTRTFNGRRPETSSTAGVESTMWVFPIALNFSMMGTVESMYVWKRFLIDSMLSSSRLAPPACQRSSENSVDYFESSGGRGCARRPWRPRARARAIAWRRGTGSQPKKGA